MPDKPLVISRHSAYVEYLQKNNLIPREHQLLEHIEDPEILKGRDVFTSGMPFHLASLCNSVTIVPLWIPQELRGKELSFEDVSKYASSSEKYFVCTQRTEVHSVYERIPEGGGYDFMCLRAQFFQEKDALAYVESHRSSRLEVKKEYIL